MTDSINFDGIRLVRSQVDRALYDTHMEAIERRHGTEAIGWDNAFAELEADDAKEQAWARGLGFEDASEYHVQTDFHDRIPDWSIWHEPQDLRP